MTNEPIDDMDLLLNAYLDGELDPVNAREIEEKLANDPSLAARYAPLMALRKALRERLPAEPAPAGLGPRISARLGQSMAMPPWRRFAAILLVGFGLAGGVAVWSRFGDVSDAVFERVVENHMRAGLAAQPFDVASSDRHTVKPWFTQRLTNAPSVVDLSSQGFTLVGGRVDVIARQPVATLVYRKREHLISVSVLATPAGSGTGNRAGYTAIGFTIGDAGYIAVSDLPRDELKAFTSAFIANSANPE